MKDSSPDVASPTTPGRMPPEAWQPPAANGALRAMFEAIGRRTSVPFRVTFVDGSTYHNQPSAPALTVRFNRAAAQWQVLLFGHVGLLEAYFDQGLDIEGDMALAFRASFEGGFDARPNPLVKKSRRQPQPPPLRNPRRRRCPFRVNRGLLQATRLRKRRWNRWSGP